MLLGCAPRRERRDAVPVRVLGCENGLERGGDGANDSSPRFSRRCLYVGGVDAAECRGGTGRVSRCSGSEGPSLRRAVLNSRVGPHAKARSPASIPRGQHFVLLSVRSTGVEQCERAERHSPGPPGATGVDVAQRVAARARHRVEVRKRCAGEVLVREEGRRRFRHRGGADGGVGAETGARQSAAGGLGSALMQEKNRGTEKVSMASRRGAPK